MGNKTPQDDQNKIDQLQNYVQSIVKKNHLNNCQKLECNRNLVENMTKSRRLFNKKSPRLVYLIEDILSFFVPSSLPFFIHFSF